MVERNLAKVEVASSNLVSRSKFYVSPAKQYGLLAQSVEHLTFNQGVPRSSRELVLKTSDFERGRGFESHPLRQMPR